MEAMDMPGRSTWEDIFTSEGSNLKLPVSQLKVDEFFIPTMDMKMVSGRAFEKDRSSDKYSVVINQTLSQMFGWTEAEALENNILYPGYDRPFDIIGVVNDFHFQSLHQNIAPLAFFHNDSHMWGKQRDVAIKFEQDKIEEVLAFTRSQWDLRVNAIPFEYSILDDELNALYANERDMGKLIAGFSAFAIFIAMLGLTGLVAFATEQRKKEIGIRKVLGASIAGIFLLINKQYIKLILVAILMAIPITWWIMQGWLDNFAYQIKLSPFAFVASAALIIFISFVSVSYLSLNAASANPAKVIKDE